MCTCPTGTVKYKHEEGVGCGIRDNWDPGPAEVLGSTYVEPEDVPTMSVGQEERQMATPAERASAEDQEGNAREVYARVAVSECSVSAEDKEDKEGNAHCV